MHYISCGPVQALCKRTMDVIRRLNDTGHAEKMQYYMSKADQVDTELDRYLLFGAISMRQKRERQEGTASTTKVTVSLQN